MGGNTMSLLTQALILGVAGGIVGAIVMNILAWELMDKNEPENEVDLEYIERMIELQKQYIEISKHIKNDFKNN